MWRRGPGVTGVAQTWVVDEIPFRMEVVKDVEREDYFINCPALGMDMERVVRPGKSFRGTETELDSVLRDAQEQIMYMFSTTYSALMDAFVDKEKIKLCVWKSELPAIEQVEVAIKKARKAREKKRLYAPGEEPEPFIL